MKQLYRHSDTHVDQEFRKVYQYIDKLSSYLAVGSILHIITRVPYDSANNESIIDKTGFLLTNGQQVEIAKYPALYAVIGIAFNSSTTIAGNMKLPTIPKTATYTGFAIRAI